MNTIHTFYLVLNSNIVPRAPLAELTHRTVLNLHSSVEALYQICRTEIIKHGRGRWRSKKWIQPDAGSRSPGLTKHRGRTGKVKQETRYWFVIINTSVSVKVPSKGARCALLCQERPDLKSGKKYVKFVWNRQSVFYVQFMFSHFIHVSAQKHPARSRSSVEDGSFWEGKPT